MLPSLYVDTRVEFASAMALAQYSGRILHKAEAISRFDADTSADGSMTLLPGMSAL